MASKFNLVVRLQHWMDSIPGQTFLNYAYSWGASVVILGALFKLTHLPGGNLMLFLGMGTEAFVFFLAAFDRPFDKNADQTELAADFETDEEIERAEALAAARRMGVPGPVYVGGAPAVGGAPVAAGASAEGGAPATEGADIPVTEGDTPAVGGGAPAVVGGAPAVVGGAPAVVGGAPAVVGGAPAVVGGAPAVVGGGVVGGGEVAAAESETVVVAGGTPTVIGGGVIGGAPVVIGGGAVVSGTIGSADETYTPAAPATPAAGETYEEPLRTAVGQMYDTTEGQTVIEQEAAKLAEIIRMANDELLRRAQAVLSPEMEEATEDYIEKLKTLNETLAKVDEQSARLTRDSQEMENLNRTLIGINKVYDLHFASISRQVTTIEDINCQTTQLAAKIEEVNNIYTRMMMQLGVLVNPMGAAVTGAATTPQPAYGQPAYGQPAYAQSAPAAE